MPNGDDKNWVRICCAVDGFRSRHGRWPTAVRLPPTYFENVVGHVLSPIGYALVSAVFDIVADKSLVEKVAIIAMDDSGIEFRYGDRGASEKPRPGTNEYFGPIVYRKVLGSGLEGIKVIDAEGNVIWDGLPIKSREPGSSPSHGKELSDFLAQVPSGHEAKANPSVTCNALYKNSNNFNCYLTPSQAISLALRLVQRAQLIREENLVDTAVQLWNQGAVNERLSLGLVNARKGPRKKTKKPPTGADN